MSCTGPDCTDPHETGCFPSSRQVHFASEPIRVPDRSGEIQFSWSDACGTNFARFKSYSISQHVLTCVERADPWQEVCFDHIAKPGLLSWSDQLVAPGAARAWVYTYSDGNTTFTPWTE